MITLAPYLKRPIFCLLFCSSLFSQSPDPIFDGLIFYAPFNGSLTPRVATGSARVEGAVTWGPGRVNLGAQTEVGVEAPLVKNLSPAKGCVSFWVKASGALLECTQDVTLFRGTEHIRFRWLAKPQTFAFMTGTVVPGQGFRWHYLSSTAGRKWKEDEWHQVVLVWDCGLKEKSLWLDGELDQETKTELMNPDYPPYAKNTMQLGDKTAAMTFDELMVWNRTLSPTEIRRIHDSPAFQLPPNFAQVLVEEIPPLRVEPKPWKNNPAGTIVHPGEVLQMPVYISNRMAKGFEGDLPFHLVDFWGRGRPMTPLHLFLRAGDATTTSVPCQADVTGVYKLTTQIAGDKTNWNRDCGSFSVMEDPAPVVDTNSFFGHHVLSWENGVYLDQAKRMGMSWMRGHNMLQSTWWIRVQPENGPFRFSLTHNDFEENKKRGFPVLGQLFGAPAWAAQTGGQKEQPNRYPGGFVPQWDLFRRYVRETVNFYKADIKYWEIGNEPEVNLFWKGSPEEFAEYCRIAYTEAKAADPTCILMSAGNTTPPRQWHEAAARAGAWKYADIMSIHMNHHGKKTTLENESEYLSVIGHFQKLATTHGPAGKPLPIWNTETGYVDTPWLSDLDPETATLEEVLPDQLSAYHGALSCVRGEILQQALGIEKHFLYMQKNLPKPAAVEGVYALEFTGSPRPKTHARAVLESFIRGATPVTPYVKRVEDNLWAFAWEKPGESGSLMAVWAESGMELEMPAPAARTHMGTIMGSRLTMDPMLRVSDEPLFLRMSTGAKSSLSYFKQVPVKILKGPADLALKQVRGPVDIPALPSFPGPDEAGPAKTFFVELPNLVGSEKTPENIFSSLGEFRQFPQGFQRHFNVPFKIPPQGEKGAPVVLIPQNAGSSAGNTQASIKIVLGGKVRALYFLYGISGEKAGPSAQCRFKYVDGSIQTFDLVQPTHLVDYRKGFSADEESKPVAFWVAGKEKIPGSWRYARVYEWQNKKSEIELASMEIDATGSGVAMAIWALTGIRW